MASPTCIVIPGVGGNELWSAGGQVLWPSWKIWLDPAAMLAGAWRFLALAPDGQSSAEPWWPRIEPRGALADYYGSTGDYLAERGWRVVSPHLDWRGTVARDAAAVVQLVQDSPPPDPVVIVAHSRGGLVARAALGLLAAGGQLDRVARVVGLGVPHQGSLSGPALLAGWERTLLLLFALLELSPRFLTGGIPNRRLNEMVASWPATYEVFPSPTSTWLSAGDVDRCYDPATWTGIGAAFSPAHLAAAAASWPALYAPPSTFDWIDGVGYGIATANALSTYYSLAVPGSTVRGADGDGVVTLGSASQPGRRRILSPTAHGALPYDGRVLYWVDQALRFGLSSDVTIEGAILGIG